MRVRTHNEVTLRLWHDHFAWLPVRVRDTWVWLERVKRKGVLHIGIMQQREWMTWEYELPEIWGR